MSPKKKGARYTKAECLACIDEWSGYIKRNIEGGECSDSYKTFQQIKADLEGAQIMESDCCGASYYLSGDDWRCICCYKTCKIVDWGGEE